MLFIGFSITALNAQENTSYFLHTVEKGQSLYSISSMYNVSGSEIIHLNPGSDKKIYAGQALKIPQAVNAGQKAIFHTIQSGESLYRLSVTYHVSVKDICDENPGLSVETFKAGQVIRIPSSKIAETPSETQSTTQMQPEVKSRCKEMHKVKRKETIYSVSRKYGITEKELMEANPELKEGMKKGKLLCIPYPKPKTGPVVYPVKKGEYNRPPSNRDLFRENQDATQSIPTVKAALILPFLTQEERRSDAVRMIEYYEGFLMAVDSLKREGTSIDLYVYDSGGENASLSSILAKEELKKVDVIFGPLYRQHIRPLADFAAENDIRLVVPILKDDEVFKNSHIYQVNITQSYLYSEVYDHFSRQFPNANVIILDMHIDDKDKGEFIQGLKVELERTRTPMQVINGATLSPETLKGVLRDDKKNIFIPTSGNAIVLNKIVPQLKLLVRENPTSNITLFGYPEWQTSLNDNLEDFFELDTYFYSSFYTSNLLPAAKSFSNAYRKWYSKEMIYSYPKYGMLGFDTGLFFLTGLKKYGTGLEQKLSSMNMTPVQTGFKFERVNNWGGFVNKKVFFIHFTKNFELVKLDFE